MHDQSQNIRHKPTFTSLLAGAVIESEAKEGSKVINRDWVHYERTMPAVCCITVMLYPIFIYRRM